MKNTLKRFWQSPHLWPIAALTVLCIFYWSGVLFTDRVLLPGDYLRGFAPFGSDPKAPWNLLRWDAMGQYYPWRLFAARELHAGRIPLWNPYQFSGTPFLANGQSAVLYPLSLPFWLMDVARAFAVSACLHSLLTCIGTYLYAIYLGRSRIASMLAAIAFGFGGYLTSWIVLPTLADTASWLPVVLLLFELARDRPADKRRFVYFVAALSCSLLAGHPQIFFYIWCALFLRALFRPRPLGALKALALGSLTTLAVTALQLLPMLELSRFGHRAAQGRPTWESWLRVRDLALPPSQYLSLFVPTELFPSYSENFGYIGILCALMALCGVLFALTKRASGHKPWFALALAACGLAYALATPFAMFFYFAVPGLSLMGGTGRAFLLWNFGMALLAAYGLDSLRALVPAHLKAKSDMARLGLPFLAALLVAGELFSASWNLQPQAKRSSIYPATSLTTYLQQLTANDHARILFITPQDGWLPSELLPRLGRAHPPGVLPPNGATVYGLNDVSGYDSLSLLSYQNFVAVGEKQSVTPLLNGNMILLNNPKSLSLDQLNTRYVVSETPRSDAGDLIKTLDGCFVYERPRNAIPQQNGVDFAPGERDGVYQPGSVRLGGFIALCTIALLTMLLAARRHD